MRKRMSGFAFGAMFCALAFPAMAQTRVPTIGFLGAAFPDSITARMESFRQGLKELGYIDGRNIKIEYRWALGKFDRLPALARELARLQVDVIVTGGPAATLPAKQATSSIPIVMAQDNDPVASGFVRSLARPGGNITGLSTLSPEISGKQLELLKEIIPALSRLAVLGNSPEPGNPQILKQTMLAANAFAVNVQYHDILGPKQVEGAFDEAVRWGAEAVLVLPSPVIVSQRKQITRLALTRRLPAMYPYIEFVEDGGLIFYGPSLPDLFYRAAVYVDKIFKGARPGDLPVEQPTKVEFVVNLRTAKQIGVPIPPNVLARADRVIR